MQQFTIETLSQMTLRQKLAALRSLGIELNAAYSHGGGNRDHAVWTVEFTGAGLAPRVFLSTQVTCRVNSGRFDGKRACMQEAKEIAADRLLMGHASN